MSNRDEGGKGDKKIVSLYRFYPLHPCLLFSQVFDDEIDQHIAFTGREDVAKRHHAVAAICDVVEDLFASGVFMFAVTDIWDDTAVVERLALAFGPVTDRTILSKERRFVGFAIRDRITLCFRGKTGSDRKNSDENRKKQFQAVHYQ